MLQRHKIAVLVAIVVLAMLMNFGNLLVVAQEGAEGHASYQLNMRTGPGVGYAVVTMLPSKTGLNFEARNEDMSWLLGHTEDGTYRGWVASLYLTYQEGFTAMRLPVSGEVVSAPAPPEVLADPVAPSEGGGEGPAGNLAPAGLVPALESVPIVPGISGNVRAIYQRGQALGNNRNVVTKVGECNSMSYAFLNPFNTGEYDLGSYGYLQRAISSTTFVNPSQATGAGYTAMTVVDAGYGNPALCPGLSPLECEYQVSRPSVAFIMLGMHDVHFLNAEQYEVAVRRIIEISIDKGVIPVLTTFPIWPSGDMRTANRVTFNNILLNLSYQYDVPLMNFWLAANSVPHSGVGVDHVHLTERGDNWTAFNGEQNQWGMTMWNLAAIQTLDQIQTQAMN